MAMARKAFEKEDLRAQGWKLVPKQKPSKLATYFPIVNQFSRSTMNLIILYVSLYDILSVYSI